MNFTDEEFKEITDKIKITINELYCGDSSGHDYLHSMRVYNNAMKIAATEKCNTQIVAVASLLHDTDDKKLFHTENYANARKIMTECNIDNEDQQAVIDIISTMSFGGTGRSVPASLEGKVVQDADRLDAIGAIGIARAFAYGGSKGRPMYAENETIRTYTSEAEYHSNNGTTLAHFYEKLFLLKDLLNTESAKKLAEKRDAFMHEFVDEFMNEC